MRSLTKRENIKKNQTNILELKNTMNEMKNIIRDHQQQNRSIRRQELWNYPIREEHMGKNGKEWRKPTWSTEYHKKTNLWIIGVTEEERVESLFKEIMAENFPNVGWDLDIQVHEAHRLPNRINLDPLQDIL